MTKLNLFKRVIASLMGRFLLLGSIIFPFCAHAASTFRFYGSNQVIVNGQALSYPNYKLVAGNLVRDGDQLVVQLEYSVTIVFDPVGLNPHSNDPVANRRFTFDRLIIAPGPQGNQDQIVEAFDSLTPDQVLQFPKDRRAAASSSVLLRSDAPARADEIPNEEMDQKFLKVTHYLVDIDFLAMQYVGSSIVDGALINSRLRPVFHEVTHT